jgi:hypothetical protein
MISMNKVIIICTFLFLSLNICQARNYFVAVEGDDNAEGTLKQPWSSIEKSIQKLQAGDVLNIQEGIYRQKFDISISGTPDKCITIRNYQDEVVNIWSTPEKLFNKTQNIYIRDNLFIDCGEEGSPDSIIHDQRTLNYFSRNEKNLSFEFLRVKSDNTPSIR